MMQLQKNVLILLISALISVSVFAQNQDEATESANSGEKTELIQAYQREFVYLNNEIQLLEDRLQEVNRDGESRVENARDELQKLEARLLELTAEVDRRTEDLQLIRDEASDAQETNDALANIINQGTSRLRSEGVPGFNDSENNSDEAALTKGEKLSMQLEYVFTNSYDLMEKYGSIRTEAGGFYLKSGEEVKGKVTKIGQIASLGASGQYAGTLAPAGGGRLWLVHPDSGQKVKQLQSETQTVQTLPLFIYDSLDELVDPSSGTSLKDTIEGGGIIGIVILAIGGVAILLIFIRVFLLWRASSRDESILQDVFSHVEQGKLKKAATAAERHKGALGRVLTATVKGVKREPQNIEDVISESVLNEQPALDRFRSALSVFAAVAPLLGLLGTVTGMIATFDVITQYGTGDPKLLSGGISEALITTELGLAVAIPVLLIGNLLSSWSDRITSNMEVAALRVVNIAAGIETADSAEEV